MATLIISSLEGRENRDFVVKINPVMGFEGPRGSHLKQKFDKRNLRESIAYAYP